MRSRQILTLAAIMFLSLGFAACGPGPAGSAAPSEFYKGRNLDLITTGTAGGYDDLLSHVVSIHLEKDTGSIVKVTNKGGAGGLEGTNYVYKDNSDGLSLGEVAAAKFIGNKIMAEPAAEYDVEKFAYILSIGHEQMYFLVSPQGPYQTASGLQSAASLKLGAGSPSGNISLGDMTVIKLLNLDAKVVTGLQNESDRALAVKRGEIAGYCMNIAGARESLAAGLIKPLFVLSSQRDPLMPEVPAISELTKVNAADMDLLKFWEDTFASSSIFIAPPDIPADRKLFLQSQAANWVKDAGFRQEVDRAAGYQITVYDTGDKVTNNMSVLAKKLTFFQSTFLDLIAKYRS